MNHILGVIILAGFTWFFIGCFFCSLVVEKYHDPSGAFVGYAMFTVFVYAVLSVFGVFGP